MNSKSVVTRSLAMSILPDSMFHEILLEAREEAGVGEEHLNPHPQFS